MTAQTTGATRTSRTDGGSEQALMLLVCILALLGLAGMVTLAG